MTTEKARETLSVAQAPPKSSAFAKRWHDLVLLVLGEERERLAAPRLRASSSSPRATRAPGLAGRPACRSTVAVALAVVELLVDDRRARGCCGSSPTCAVSVVAERAERRASARVEEAERRHVLARGRARPGASPRPSDRPLRARRSRGSGRPSRGVTPRRCRGRPSGSKRRVAHRSRWTIAATTPEPRRPSPASRARGAAAPSRGCTCGSREAAGPLLRRRARA